MRRLNDTGLTVETKAYVSGLRNLTKTCNFGSLHDSVRDRIVFGIHSKPTRQKLLQEHKLTLEKCTSSQMKEIASGSNLEAVNKVEDPPHGK